MIFHAVPSVEKHFFYIQKNKTHTVHYELSFADDYLYQYKGIATVPSEYQNSMMNDAVCYLHEAVHFDLRIVVFLYHHPRADFDINLHQ